MTDNGRSFGRLRSWTLFVVWIAWIVGSAATGVLPSLVAITIASLFGMLWLRSLIDPEPWSRGRFRRDNLAARAGRARVRAARRANRARARNGPPGRAPGSTQRARAAARRERNRARRLG